MLIWYIFPRNIINLSRTHHYLLSCVRPNKIELCLLCLKHLNNFHSLTKAIDWIEREMNKTRLHCQTECWILVFQWNHPNNNGNSIHKTKATDLSITMQIFRSLFMSQWTSDHTHFADKETKLMKSTWIAGNLLTCRVASRHNVKFCSNKPKIFIWWNVHQT